MAIGLLIQNPDEAGSSVAQHVNTARAASVQSKWFVLNDDAKTAATAGHLLTPSSLDKAGIHWTRVPPWATRILIRFGYTGTLGTLPVVRLIGAGPAVFSTANVGSASASGGNGNPLESTGAFSATTTSPNYAVYDRIDNSDQNAAGVTLAGANPWTDGTNLRGRVSTILGYDLLGCRWVAAPIETAAGTVTLGWIEGKFLN